jgi:hypothetical protein
MNSKLLLLCVALVVLILSSVFSPLTGYGVDTRGLGLAGMLIVAYLIMSSREKHKSK